MTERQTPSPHSVAILSRGDAAMRRDATPQNGRFVEVFEALAAVGIKAYPAIYDESFAGEIRKQLLAVDGVLVWVNPIQDGRNRAGLDALLREIAALGRTRMMGWGSDTALYQTTEAMRAELPARLAI